MWSRESPQHSYTLLPTMALIGGGTDAESTALQTAFSGLSNTDFGRLRVCYEIPGRPRGPHVSATERGGGAVDLPKL
jgi:hypothetical protein